MVNSWGFSCLCFPSAGLQKGATTTQVVCYHYTAGPQGPDREVTKDTGQEKSDKNQSPLNPGNCALSFGPGHS